MKIEYTLKKNCGWILLASLAMLLAVAPALRADVTLTDRQAVEKEARKKMIKHEKKGEKARTIPNENRGSLTATGSQSLIDDSALEWFINSDITFITSSSASGAASEASYTHAVAASTSAGGTTSSTLNDLFDGYNGMAISFSGATGPVSTGNPNYNIYNNNGAASTECSGRQVVLGAQIINNIRVQRKIYVPDNDAFCRWLNIFTNQDTVSRTFNMITGNNMGSDSNTIIVTTSDGDASAEIGDNWVTTMQNYSGGTSPDPRAGHVLKGPGAPVGLANILFTNGDDNPYWAYTLTLTPGETAIIMNFAVGQPNKAAAASSAGLLVASMLAASASRPTASVGEMTANTMPTNTTFAMVTMISSAPTSRKRSSWFTSSLSTVIMPPEVVSSK